MAEPKKRTNRSKRNMRRMHDKTSLPSLIYCPECHAAMLKHHVCNECGSYKGQKVIAKEEVVKIKAEEKE